MQAPAEAPTADMVVIVLRLPAVYALPNGTAGHTGAADVFVLRACRQRLERAHRLRAVTDDDAAREVSEIDHGLRWLRNHPDRTYVGYRIADPVGVPVKLLESGRGGVNSNRKRSKRRKRRR